MIKDLIDSALIIESLEASAKEEALDEMLAAAVKSKLLPGKQSKGIRKLLAEREKMGSTGIGNGVAVPHVKSEELKSACMVLARAPGGLPYSAVDGKDVQTLFMVLAPKDAAEAHLQILRWIAGLARNADFRRFVQGADGEAEIRDLLHEMSE
ncbi:MAG: PTS sugar transporter subunit IIA [Planctomycetota bacterium]|jgi:mannitol/fructose-specific phosphotransferase system IIA component (Ntr-type)